MRWFLKILHCINWETRKVNSLKNPSKYKKRLPNEWIEKLDWYIFSIFKNILEKFKIQVPQLTKDHILIEQFKIYSKILLVVVGVQIYKRWHCWTKMIKKKNIGPS